MGGTESRTVTMNMWEPEIRDQGLIERNKFGSIEFDIEPFDAGSFRYAFTGTICGSKPENFQSHRVVVKVFKSRFTKREDVLHDIAALQIATKFANLFNGVSNINKTIKFCEPMVAQIREKGFNEWFLIWGGEQSGKYSIDEYVTVEQFLDGGYMKWNSNWGYFQTDSITMPAFSHFTFHQSDCDLLVCDLQGCQEGLEYHLTDPAIHSRDKKFGLTDCGSIGMLVFFATHKCNWICENFRKPKLSPKVIELVDEAGLTCGSCSGSMYDFTASRLVDNAKIQQFSADVLDGMNEQQQMASICEIMKEL